MPQEGTIACSYKYAMCIRRTDVNNTITQCYMKKINIFSKYVM